MDTLNELNILRHDSNTLSMNSIDVSVLKQSNKISLCRFLKIELKLNNQHNLSKKKKKLSNSTDSSRGIRSCWKFMVQVLVKEETNKTINL